MILGVQYYRPPFPEKRYWKDDLSLIRDSGLNTLQLWACWGWIEPEPGIFKFDDYDELIVEARKRGLGVIISTIAEIQPFWIHRLIPDSYMIDHLGNRVISSLRNECNVGLTPGGCSDNPQVLELMANFLKTIAKRYREEKNLLGWDCWNETRWAVQADGYVCYCPHTIKLFREWLKENYKDLEGLNKAWKRRYCQWGDVFPGKLPGRPYTEMMEFLRFLTWRATQHMRFRYQAIKSQDKKHVITAHCGQPAIMSVGGGFEQTLCRGNDWHLADQLDGFGSSHFPLVGKFDETTLGMRIEAIHSAARGKIMWVSELQGGSARSGYMVDSSVSRELQQRWVWNSYGRGAKAIIFWCWRDEVFGRESSGFGLSGNDGMAEARFKAMKKTGKIVKMYNELLQAYKPDDPKVGVFFEPDNYYLNWAGDGNSELAGQNLLGYLTALERIHIPYEVVESSHLDILDKLKVLFMPWSLVIQPEVAHHLIEFLKSGGTIFCEAETDSFTPLGFYRYPGKERSFMSAVGISDEGRRVINQERVEVVFKNKKFSLKPSGWFTPLVSKNASILGKDVNGNALFLKQKLGKGEIYVVGTFIGLPYYRKRYRDFKDLLFEIVEQKGGIPELKMESKEDIKALQWRTGISGKYRLLFLINSGSKRSVLVSAPKKFFGGSSAVEELCTGEKIPIKIKGNRKGIQTIIESGDFAVLRW